MPLAMWAARSRQHQPRRAVLWMRRTRSPTRRPRGRAAGRPACAA